MMINNDDQAGQQVTMIRKGKTMKRKRSVQGMRETFNSKIKVNQSLGFFPPPSLSLIKRESAKPRFLDASAGNNT